MNRLRHWWRYDSNERRVRATDRVEMIVSVLSILLVVAMFVWVHNQGIDLGSAQRHLATEQRELDKQQKALTHQQAQLGAQHLAQVEGCKRLQIVRVEENISYAAAFAVYSDVLAEFARATGSHFATSLRRAVSSTTWVPRTNCAEAVNAKGVRYRAPRPVRFVDRPPPPSALTLYPSDFR